MLSVKVSEATDTIFKVFGKTHLESKSVYHDSQANALTHEAGSLMTLLQ